MNVVEALKEAEIRLAEAAVIDPRREAASLTAFALDRDRTFLIAHPEYEVTPLEAERFASLLERRASREPLQYITGRQEFFGLDFRVTPDVLIPRPETEILVEAAIAELRKGPVQRFCEIGVGSGCIAVSVLHSVPGSTAVGVDISPAALGIAAENAAAHGVSSRLELLVSDVYESVDADSFAMIVSNPPYVPAMDVGTLQAEVGGFEPHVALTDGSDGLSIIRRIISGAPGYLVPGGRLLIEIGFGQHEKVAAMLDERLWAEIGFLDDLQGIPRTLSARLRSLPRGSAVN